MAGIVNELIASEIEKELTRSPFVFFTRFAGLKVSEFEELRCSLEGHSERCLVVKKRLAQQVLKRLGHEGAADLMDGMSCFMTVNEEPQEVSKTLVKFAKGRGGNFEIRGALMEGKVVSLSYVNELAKLPSKGEIQAKAVSAIKAPITNFVLNLRGVLQSLVFVLNAARGKVAQAAD